MAKPSSRRVLGGWLAGVLAAAAVFGPLAVPARAQDYPARPITLIVPFPPGGSTDFAGRLLAEHMGTALGQRIVVENRAGAAGAIGVAAVARAPADGYTIGLSGTGSSILAHLLGPAPGYSMADLAIIGNASLVDLILVARPTLAAGTVAELVAAAKAAPGKITYASSGTPTRLAFELLGAMTGMSLLHVPYRGDAPALADLRGGHVDLALLSVSGAIGQIQTGSIRPIALTSAKRIAALPEVPTIAESGLPGYDATPSTLMVAPKGTPAAIVLRLNQALNQALGEPALRERYAALGLTAMPQSPDAAAALLAADTAKWAKVIRDANITE